MASASVPIGAPRILRATRRIHRGYLVGALLTAAAVAGSYNLYQTRPVVERAVVVATHDVPRGAILRPEDFAPRSTPLDDQLYAVLLHPGQEAELVGRAAPEELHAGLPIGAAQVAAREELGPDQALVGLAIPPDTVPLQKGDWVQVWATPRAGGHSTAILDRAQVLQVRTDAVSRVAGGVGADRGPQVVGISLAVRPAEARALLEARRDGELAITRLPASGAAAQLTPAAGLTP